MVRKARRLEKVGYYKEAAKLYFDGLRRNPKNTKAIIGVKTTGQKVLDDHLRKFYKAYSFEQYKEAIFSYKHADSVFSQIKGYNVTLDFPSYYVNYFDESKSKYLPTRYKEGKQLLDDEEFEKAEAVFKEIVYIQQDYKDADKLRRIAYVEPLYRSAQVDRENRHFRTAYYKYDEILEVKAGYKDVLDLKEEVRLEALLTIAFIPLPGEKTKIVASNEMAYQVLQDITREKDPLIKVVDRQNIDKLIEEQKLALSGLVDNSTAAQAGQILGVKAVFFGYVTHSAAQEGYLKSERKTAYEKVVTYVYNSETKKKDRKVSYDKVYYNHYTRTNSVSLTFYFKLVSSETGEILTSGTYKKSHSDFMEYSTYSGNVSKLYKTENGVYNPWFRKKFRNSSAIKSTTVLMNELHGFISRDVVSNIKIYEASRI
ncbi:CsgG/HfaB family protein [Cyclobacteriaceae bacterium]|nr:CsgG/HfaB family protein [Cyclobacteriaceae bacterium]